MSEKKAPKLPVLESLNWLIHLNYIKRDFNTCKNLIREQLAQTNGLCEFALYINGLILRQEGRIQESLEQFQTCAALNPKNGQNIKQVARSLFLLGRHKTAIDVYNEALALCPNDWEIVHNLGVCFLQLKMNEKAKAFFKESINLSKNELSFQMLAKIFIKESNNQAAIEILTKAIEFNAESCELLTILGLLYMKDKQYQKAFEALGNALTYNPTHYSSILAMCNMIQIHSDFDVALNKYRIAANTVPESARLWNNIGMCFFGKKKYVAAISCLKRATYLSPFEWKILYNLGLIHLNMQQYASAFRYLSAGINFKPKEGIIYSLLAVALNHLNDATNARDAYERALQLDPENVYTNLNFAIFLYNQGDLKQASAKLNNFHRFYGALVQAKKRDVDVELQSVAARLGPVLNFGETKPAPTIVQEEQPVGEPHKHQEDSSNKYKDLSSQMSNNNSLYRESSIATISNIDPHAGLTSAMSARSYTSSALDQMQMKANDFSDDL